MAFDAWWHENFMEWPVGQRIGLYSGTGWSGSGAGTPTKVTDTNFPGGSAMEFTASNIVGVYSIGTTSTAVTQCINWKMNRVVDFTATGSAKSGIAFQNAAGHQFLLIFGILSGQPNSFQLWTFNNTSSTFTLVATSANIYSSLVVYDWGWVWSATTGILEVWINNELVFSTNLGVNYVGSNFTTVFFGRFGTGTGNGTARVSHIYGYSDSAYLGPVEIRGSFPTADQALQDWGFVGGASAWESINNTFLNPPVQYIESSTLGDISQFDCPVDDSEVVGIFSVSSEYYATRTDISAIDMCGQIVQGVDVTNGITYSPPQTTPERFRDVYTSNPNTTMPWVPSDLPALGIGFERLS